MAEWTKERVKTLRDLWAEGYSASEIAIRLGGFAHCADGGRSAICGKVWRLELQTRRVVIKQSQRWSAANARRRKAQKQAKQKKVTPRWKVEKIPQPAQGDVARVSFDDLDETWIVIPMADGTVRMVKNHCKWPVLDHVPAGHVKQYCGDERIAGLPYCQAHALRAFAPPVQRQPNNYRTPGAKGAILVRAMGAMKFEREDA